MTLSLTSSGMLARPRPQHLQQSSFSPTASPVCWTKQGHFFWVLEYFAWSGVHGASIEAAHRKIEGLLVGGSGKFYLVFAEDYDIPYQLRPWSRTMSVCWSFIQERANMAFGEHTSKKPDMKLSGNLLSPLKFSSLKYDMTWFVCFQKFIVSCCLFVSPFALSRTSGADIRHT